MSLFFRNAASLLSDGDQNGTWLRFMVDHDAGRRRTAARRPTARAAPRPRRPTAAGGRSTSIDPNFLHVNPYPNTAAPGQTRECEAGNETYAQGKQAIGNVPGNQGIETDEQGPRRRRASNGGLRRHRSTSSRAGCAAGSTRVRAGAIALLIIVVGTWLAFTKSLPWQRPVRVPRGLPDLEQPAPRLAGADRRRQRRQGRRRSSARRTPTWSRSRWR